MPVVCGVHWLQSTPKRLFTVSAFHPTRLFTSVSHTAWRRCFCST